MDENTINVDEYLHEEGDEDMHEEGVSMDEYVDGQRYAITEYLGRGAYGMVFAATDTINNEYVALKRIKLEQKELTRNVIRETSILMEMEHENIVRLKRVLIENDYVYLVMERLDTDLNFHRSVSKSKYRRPIIIKLLLKQILRGVEFSHSRGVLHRDLKMQNILLNTSEGKVKIADFGSARGFVDMKSDLSPNVTTVNYRAPEVLLGEAYSTAMDMWSVGCVFAEMVTGRCLFEGGSEIQILKEICGMVGFEGDHTRITLLSESQKVSFPTYHATVLEAVLDAAGHDLLLKLLELNPRKRITAEAALQHDYLKDVDLTSSRETFNNF